MANYAYYLQELVIDAASGGERVLDKATGLQLSVDELGPALHSAMILREEGFECLRAVRKPQEGIIEIAWRRYPRMQICTQLLTPRGDTEYRYGRLHVKGGILAFLKVLDYA